MFFIEKTKEFDKWLDANAALHKQLMQEAGFIAK
jgi:hypothetical protein